MGKWTAGYYDDVLTSKIKNLVSGAVKRSKLEKAEPTISFETFVEDLDTGDSFTTTIIEILVKELAERRQRQATADKRLVSDRTAKSLRMLAAPQRVFRQSGPALRGLNRRTFHLSEYLSTPPEAMEIDDDNDSFESLVDASGAMEGARFPTDLYNAYLPSSSASNHPVSRSRARLPGNLDALDEIANIPRPTFPGYPGTTNPQGSTLSRQPSVRRPPARSRTVDFNDFTSRRRSTTRESPAQEPGTELTGESGASSTERRGSLSNTAPPRRFFPQMRRLDLPWSASSDHDSRPYRDSLERERPYLSWLSSTAPLPLPSVPAFHPTAEYHNNAAAADNNSNSDDARPGPPRLRRGGLRPPESLRAFHDLPGRHEDEDEDDLAHVASYLASPGAVHAEDAEAERAAQPPSPLPVSVSLDVRGFSPAAEN